MPVHYRWVILLGGAVGSFMTTPAQTAGVGTLAGVLPAPLVGRWIDHRGPRLTAAVIGLALGVACVVMASSRSALFLTLAFAAQRGSAVGALSLVRQHVINLSFVTRRGLAAAPASFGLALGAMIFPLLTEVSMRLVGWRWTYVVLGAVVFTTMTLVGGLLFRNRPERFGLTPDTGRAAAGRSARAEPTFTRSAALRTGCSGRCRPRMSPAMPSAPG